MKGADIMNSNLEELLKLSKEVYGRYAFKFELLNDKIKESDRNEMILGAISCGEAWAQKFKNIQKSNIFELIKEYNLEFKISKEAYDAYGRNLLGFFNYPKTITIMDSALKILF